MILLLFLCAKMIDKLYVANIIIYEEVFIYKKGGLHGAYLFY